MTLAAEHLIRLGHKRIAFVGGGRQASPARDRAIAYRETLARYGLPIGPVVNCPPTREEGATRGRRAAARPADDPTAILCFNDVCAFGVMLGLADRGLAAGRDCAVIGFDNIAEAAHYRPALTTIEIGARQIGEEAAHLLLRRIKAPHGAPESVDPAAATDHPLELRRRRPPDSQATSPALNDQANSGTQQGGRRMTRSIRN